MKDTYWLLIGIFAAYGLIAGVVQHIATRRAEQRRIETELRVVPEKKPSIWTIDLFETRWGRFFAAYIFAPAIMLFGILSTTSQEARWKGFTYHGFDAICMGIGIVCIGITMFLRYGFPIRSEKDIQIRNYTTIAALVIWVVCFATALLRNI